MAAVTAPDSGAAGMPQAQRSGMDLGGQPARAAGRLGLGTLDRLPADARPLLLPGSVPAGVVHIGLGAFHRAHQAIYTEEAVAAGGGDWGIIGVAPRSTEVISQLTAQDLLFSVTSLDGSGARTRAIGALAGVRHAASDPDAVVALLADPAIRVVTLTVTEKAYLLDPATGRLRRDDDVLADLTTDRPPRTVPGLLVRGLLARAQAGGPPLALVSCDNLPANGRRVHSMVQQALEFAAPGESIMDWLRANVSCPGTMVDRIVPASTPETLATAQRALGVTDLAAVAAEPYTQWVIEDMFPGGRPPWELAGAVLTDDAQPWERLKLRTLNGVHSALAYLGALAGAQTIADALALPGMRDALTRLIAEDISPSFEPPAEVTVTDYGASVLERFANPAICHRTLQVAMDGSQKLPQRVLHTLLDRRSAGAQPRWAALVVAAWMRFARGYADDGRELPLDDPLAGPIRAALAGAGRPAAGGDPAALAGSAATVDALLRLRQVFPEELADDPVARELITHWLAALDRHGVLDTLSEASR